MKYKIKVVVIQEEKGQTIFGQTTIKREKETEVNSDFNIDKVNSLIEEKLKEIK